MKRNIFAVALSFLALVILICCLVSCGDARALFDDKLTFVSNGDGTCYLSKAEGFYGKNAVIPTVSPEGETVIGIGNDAFAGSGISGITIPEGVRYIGARAFASCEMLEALHLPASVEEIGVRAVEGCASLDTLEVSADNTKYTSVGNCIIERESGVLVLGCGKSVIPDDGSVTAIGDGAFYRCASFEKLFVPDGVTAIGNSAFYGCSGLKVAILAESLTDIGSYAFDGCSSVEKIVLFSGITALNEGVFRNCSSLAEVILPEGLEMIGNLAFFGCETLVDPVLPESLKSIGELAFGGCKSLIHIKFPQNVEYIADGAFLYCDMLWGIKVDKNNAVYRAETNCLIRRSDGVILVGTRGSKIPEDESVTAIADRAFHGAMMLRSIRIPSNIKYIGKEAFYGCYYLVDAVICGDNTEIGARAFYNCASLQSVYLSDGVAKIGADVFGECPSLTRISLGADSLPQAWDSAWDSAWNGSSAQVVFSQKEIPPEKE